jgi:hypothetical protein
MKYRLDIETEIYMVSAYSEKNEIESVLKEVREWLLTSESGETPIYSLKITLEE